MPKFLSQIKLPWFRTNRHNAPADAESASVDVPQVEQPLDVAVKDAITGVTWDGDVGWQTIGGSLTNRSPNSDIDWEGEAGIPWHNSVISLCLQYIYNKVIEPRVHVVYEDGEGKLQPVPKHPCSALLLKPNGEYSGNALLQAMCLSYAVDGNAYCRKVRGNKGYGVPVELWWIPHWQIAPIPPENGGPTEFYLYREPTPNGGVKKKLIPRRDIIHVRNGIDPDNPRIGYRTLKAQLRGICSDNEIDTVVATVLRNFGVLGNVVMPESNKEGEIISKDQMEAIVRRIRNASAGDARGGTVGIPITVKLHQLGMSPEEMMVKESGDRPQARICAAFNIDPAAIGLMSIGRGGEKYGALRKEVRAATYENCILPILAAMAERDTYELLPDFGENPDGYWVEYDYSRVRDLQENADSASSRARGEWNDGLLTLDEGRAKVGAKPCPDKDMGGKFKWQLFIASDEASDNEETTPGAGDKPEKEDEDDGDEDETE